MLKKIIRNKTGIFLLLILIITFFTRFIRISKPNSYIFDEVYHVVTAKAYSQNNLEAYNPFAKAPEPNTAYDWLHPPLAKLIQASSIKIFGNNSLAWRFPSVIFGVLSVFALYYFSLTIFKNKNLGLLSALFLSLDGLHLTMSRICMNDIFVTTWIIFALTFFYKTLKKIGSEPSGNSSNLLFTGLFTGLGRATKWSALLLFPIYTLFIFVYCRKSVLTTSGSSVTIAIKKILKLFIFLLILPLTIYFLSYSQFFLQGHTLKDFFALHQQIYWYQNGLTATHNYQSPAWQWPFLIKPVWFYVNYLKNSVANIYNLGNPVIFWGGLVAVVQWFGNSKPLNFLITSYFLLFLPWIFSPRIMFLHHYLPALPFLCLIIAKAIFNNKKLTKVYTILVILSFIFFYPLNTAIPISNTIKQFWFWLPTWR